MKLEQQAFTLATILFIFIAAEKTADTANPLDTLDTKIKITSLESQEKLRGARPIAIPLISDSGAGAPGAEPENFMPPIPRIDAEIAAVSVLNSSEELLKFNPEKRHPLASITKLITAMVATDLVGFQSPVVLTEMDIAEEGTMGDFKAGETYTVGDLVKSMLMVSSNDAGFAIARFYGYEDFMNAMTAKIRGIGMENTSVYDPVGLSELNQTTARDLQLLTKYLMQKYPQILSISREKETELAEIGSGGRRIIKNINKFAGNPDFVGGKTGYTDEARGNLLSIFSYNGKTLLIIVLGSDDRFGETKKLYEWVKKVL